MNKATGLNVTTWAVRVIMGLTFTFSGFAKAIDPWGLLYKTEEYLSALSISIWPNLLLVGVFSLCALEFILGVFLLFGCFRRSVSLFVVALMCFMLPLTAWIVISDPVKDCGCFGDAYTISNWASFWKNVVLMVGALWLLKHNATTHWMITPALQWLAFLASGLFIIAVELFGYASQPLIDFRPYKVGGRLIDETDNSNQAQHFIFIYEKDGERKEFGENDELPSEEEGWNFIDRVEVKASNAGKEKAGDHNFRIWSEDGEEDVTEDVVSEEGKELLVMMPDMGSVSPATTWKINSLYEWAEAHDVRMIGVVAGTPNEIESWKDISMASYPIYSADDTQIKEVVRGNPGIVFLENGVVGWKSTLSALNIDDFMQPEISDDARNFGLDNERILRNISYIYVIVMIMLVVMSFLPRLKNLYFKSNNSGEKEVEKEATTHDDTAPL